jgi:hypothetical protein
MRSEVLLYLTVASTFASGSRLRGSPDDVKGWLTKSKVFSARQMSSRAGGSNLRMSSMSRSITKASPKSGFDSDVFHSFNVLNTRSSIAMGKNKGSAMSPSPPGVSNGRPGSFTTNSWNQATTKKEGQVKGWPSLLRSVLWPLPTLIIPSAARPSKGMGRPLSLVPIGLRHPLDKGQWGI